MFLPLQDLQGEISGLVGANILKTQVDTAVEMPTVFAAVKDSGVIDVTPAEDTRGYTKPISVERGSLSNAEYVNRPKCHQETQTDISWRAVADVFSHMPFDNAKNQSL